MILEEWYCFYVDDEFLRFENLIHLENCWIRDKELVVLCAWHVCLYKMEYFGVCSWTRYNLAILRNV